MKTNHSCMFIAIIVLYIGVCIACDKQDNNEKTPDYQELFKKELEKYVSQSENLVAPIIISTDSQPGAENYSTIAHVDTICCTGFLDDKLWVALYKKSDATKLFEWLATEPWPYIMENNDEKVMAYDLGYGDKKVIPCIYPTFFLQYEDYTVMEIYMPLWSLGNSLWSRWYQTSYERGMFDFHHKYKSCVTQIIFYDGQNNISTPITYFPEYCDLYYSVIDGYKESIIITRELPNIHRQLKIECLSYFGEILYELDTYMYPNIAFKDALRNADSASGMFVSYEDYVYVSGSSPDVYATDDLALIKYNFREQNEVYRKKIIPPFDVPEDAKPIIRVCCTKQEKNYAYYAVTMLYYDGSEHKFNFRLNFVDETITDDSGKVLTLVEE